MAKAEAKDTIDKAEVLRRFPNARACAARESKGRFERDGNWQELAHMLRHKDCEAAKVTVVDQDGATILRVEPVAVKPPEGKVPFVRPAFHLIVT